MYASGRLFCKRYLALCLDATRLGKLCLCGQYFWYSVVSHMFLRAPLVVPGRRGIDEFRLRPKVHATKLHLEIVCIVASRDFNQPVDDKLFLVQMGAGSWPTELVLHMCRDARHRRKNFRFFHCFQDEDGMKHLKCALADFVFLLCQTR